MTVRSIVCDDVSCIIDLCHMSHVPTSHYVLYHCSTYMVACYILCSLFLGDPFDEHSREQHHH